MSQDYEFVDPRYIDRIYRSALSYGNGKVTHNFICVYGSINHVDCFRKKKEEDANENTHPIVHNVSGSVCSKEYETEAERDAAMNAFITAYCPHLVAVA